MTPDINQTVSLRFNLTKIELNVSLKETKTQRDRILKNWKTIIVTIILSRVYSAVATRQK